MQTNLQVEVKEREKSSTIPRLFDFISSVNHGITYGHGENCRRSRLMNCGENKHFGLRHVNSEFPIGLAEKMIHRKLVICVWKVG